MPHIRFPVLVTVSNACSLGLLKTYLKTLFITASRFDMGCFHMHSKPFKLIKDFEGWLFQKNDVLGR